MYLPTIILKHFLFGERSVQISHTRLRNKCGNFNADLFNKFLRENAICACGANYKDVYHLFFQCPLYNNARLVLFQASCNSTPIYFS